MNSPEQVFSNAIHQTRADNLEQAIDCYQQALAIMTREETQVPWTKVMNNPEQVVSNPIQQTRADSLEQAIDCYQQALAVITREEMPLAWAATIHQLAHAYQNRMRGEHAANLEQAIDYYKQALQIRTCEAMPAEWADTMMGLAHAYQNRIRGEHAANLEQAVSCYEQILEKLITDYLPESYLRVQQNLSDLYFSEEQWTKAHAAQVAAIEAKTIMLAEAFIETEREIIDTVELYLRDAYCLLRLDRRAEALQRLIQSKDWLLVQALTLGHADLNRLSEQQCADILATRQLIHYLKTELQWLPKAYNRCDGQYLKHMLRTVRYDLKELIQSIRAERPDFMPKGLDLNSLLALIPSGGALVAPLFTSKGSAVFVVPEGAKTVSAENVIEIKEFTTKDLQALLLSSPDDHDLGGWLSGYGNCQNDQMDWFGAIESITQTLWHKLIAPVHERLKKLEVKQGAFILLMLQSGLNMLPLHAAWRVEDEERRSFLDDYTVINVPNSYALDVDRYHLEQRDHQQSTLLAVVNSSKDLGYTSAEGEVVAELFNINGLSQTLTDDKATIEAVTNAVANCSHLHFSCCGLYNWIKTVQSGLVMADGELLTFPDIISRLDLRRCRLVTLSTHGTGIINLHQDAHELQNIHIAFLQAGAAGVVSSLWPVDDLSTLLLMEHFYKNHLHSSRHPAAALGQAQQWLRDVTARELREQCNAKITTSLPTNVCWIDVLNRQYMRFAAMESDNCPFAHPYYWAAFIYNGV